MADAVHARRTAKRFVDLLARNGTTTALVFGAHFPAAQELLFEEAERAGLRITSGLVVSDRNLRDDLEVTPDVAYETSRALRERWHGRGRLRYAVTPRFWCRAPKRCSTPAARCSTRRPTALFTSHVNESPSEIEFVRELFPQARDYVDTYERAGLLRECSVLAHNVHVSDDELQRLARITNRRRALPILQRLPGLRHLPDGAPRRARRALRDGDRRRRGHGPLDVQGGPRRLPRADGPRAGPDARPAPPAVPRDKGGSRRARPRPHAATCSPARPPTSC